jgi:hypothetical protein
MQVNRAPARTGWRWVLEGFGLLRRHPLALLGLTVLFLFTVVLPTAIPVVGGFAPLLLTPALSVGYMQAVRTAESGRMPSPWMLYDGLRAQKGRGARPLLILGLINCLLTVGVLALTMLADGGTLFRIATGAIAADDPAMGERGLVFAAVVFLLLYTPVQMAMWYAPVFVAWHRLSPVQALFYSLVGVWRNKGAFTLYAIGWFCVAVALSIAVQLIKPMLPGNLMALLLSPLSLIMLSALYCSFWPSYRDVIVDGPASGPAQASGEVPPAA